MTREKEEILQQLQVELEWVKYRIRMLDIMNIKLRNMKAIAERASINISLEERMELNKSIKYLEAQVNALDEESSYE